MYPAWYLFARSAALFVIRKFGTKSLINLLSSLGFCASYHEAQQLELLTIYHSVQPTPAGTFCQYIFGNAYFNVATLDSLNTFHSMGGTKCITPSRALPPADSTKRVKSVPTDEEVGKLGVLELLISENVKMSALQQIVFQDLNVLNHIPSQIFSSCLLDILLMSGKYPSSQ
ncbi:hypothetical protein AVEN_237921-1 [Araneus ventricosus]|uniref:Uncharacterized protein n=1 Tax=Araneus ventricosus TaxID=182803 RepID=A0A4Y2G1A3_ARAVE|nr:hypothetical protein AVEN_237921-1 [Araneus ventricosus]